MKMQQKIFIILKHGLFKHDVMSKITLVKTGFVLGIINSNVTIKSNDI